MIEMTFIWPLKVAVLKDSYTPERTAQSVMTADVAAISFRARFLEMSSILSYLMIVYFILQILNHR